jgi:hypothetical protein
LTALRPGEPRGVDLRSPGGDAGVDLKAGELAE